MLDSYFEEIKKKRQKNLFFWFLVCIFAIGLYFFFKGKYISINLNWNHIFGGSGNIIASQSHSGSQSGNIDNSLISFHSFGIVNVKVFPENAFILLNDKKYNNNSNPRVDYGKYTLSVSQDGYKSGVMNFTIDDTQNFYIDDITLLKNPDYKKFPKIKDARIIPIADDSWITYSSSGMHLYQEDFLTGSLIQKAHFDSIGGNKFILGSKVIEYSPLTKQWITETNPNINAFVKSCNNPMYQHGLYVCDGKNAVMTQKGKTLTGVVDHGKNFLLFEQSVMLGNIAEGNIKTLSLTGGTIPEGTTLGKNFIEITDNWFNITKEGKLLLLDSKSTPQENITTGLDTIDFVQKVGDYHFFIGKKGDKKTLSIINFSKAPYKMRTLEFPDIPLDEVRIYEKNRNYFIKTKNALLFFYRESDEIEWIIDGKILAIGDTFALYEKEDGIWLADWKDKNLKK